MWRALLKFGAPLDGVSPDDFTAENLIYQIGVRPVRIDIITAIDGVEWTEAWASHVVIEFEGLQLPVISIDLLIRNKRATGRPKDQVDADALERRAAKKRRKRK